VPLLQLGAQAAVLLLQPQVFERVAHDEDDFLERERLLHEIESSELGGAHRRLDISVAGNHHHYGRAIVRVNSLECFEAVHFREPHIEKNHVETALLEPLETFLAGGDGFGAVTLVAQECAKRFADSAFVVNDKNRSRHSVGSPALEFHAI